MLKQPRKGINTGMLIGLNHVNRQHVVAYVSTNEILKARASLHGLVISCDKIHAPISSA